MKQLGDLILPDSLQWIDRDSWSPVNQEAATTLGGGTVIFSQTRIDGRPVTLEATDGITWLDQDAVDALKAMASQAGATFTLTWESESFTVLFGHHNPPAVSFTPLWPNHDLFTGTIKLIQA